MNQARAPALPVLNFRALALAAALLVGTACIAQPAGVAAGADADFTYTTVRGDTLIGLGKRFLVDPGRWPELAQANALRNPNRIATGTELRIPLRLMRSTPAPATIVSVIGKAEGAAGALQKDQTVPEGGGVTTGPDGHVTIRLIDGTLLRLRPDSRLNLRESRELRDAQAVRSGARLDKGRVEVEAAPAKPGRRGFSIDTPQGVLGVRGTEFRVAIDEQQGTTRGEVLGGVVAFDAAGKADTTAASTRVEAGFGSVIGTAGVKPPVRLLPAPQTAQLPALQERVFMRFPLQPLDGAATYRGQIARDSRFDLVVADLTSATPELRFGDLPDGDYVLRVRAVDAQGLEGRDADHRFRLKARPEAPLPSAPAPKAVSYGSRADFVWTANQQAQHYRLQLAATPDFKQPLRDINELRELATTVDGLQPGTYHWRLASVRAVNGQGSGPGTDQGPWGDPRSFELRPPPPQPKPPVVGDSAVAFAWEGLPGQTFEFQVARDMEFKQLVLERRLTQPGIDLAQPGTGRFYVRLRAIDPDGFVGPYTTPQYFDIPNCLRDGSGGCVRAAEQTLNLAN